MASVYRERAQPVLDVIGGTDNPFEERQRSKANRFFQINSTAGAWLLLEKYDNHTHSYNQRHVYKNEQGEE